MYIWVCLLLQTRVCKACYYLKMTVRTQIPNFPRCELLHVPRAVVLPLHRPRATSLSHQLHGSGGAGQQAVSAQTCITGGAGTRKITSSSLFPQKNIPFSYSGGHSPDGASGRRRRRSYGGSPQLAAALSGNPGASRKIRFSHLSPLGSRCTMPIN